MSPTTQAETRIFIGWYHFRAQAPQTKVFNHTGDLKSAIERFQVHCTEMNYRFIKVRPYIVDLDEQEKTRKDFGGDSTFD